MHPLADLSNAIKRSLSILDNHYVRLVIVVLLVLYSAGVAPQLNKDISDGLSNMWVRLVVLLVIMAVSVKDVALALLLAIAYVLTVHMASGGVEEGVDPAPEDLGEYEEVAPVHEGMDGTAPAPEGYNAGVKSCLQNCADGESVPNDTSNPCSPVATWNNELNAQGMNCPMGYGGDELATF